MSPEQPKPTIQTETPKPEKKGWSLGFRNLIKEEVHPVDLSTVPNGLPTSDLATRGEITMNMPAQEKPLSAAAAKSGFVFDMSSLAEIIKAANREEVSVEPTVKDSNTEKISEQVGINKEDALIIEDHLGEERRLSDAWIKAVGGEVSKKEALNPEAAMAKLREIVDRAQVKLVNEENPIQQEGSAERLKRLRAESWTGETPASVVEKYKQGNISKHALETLIRESQPGGTLVSVAEIILAEEALTRLKLKPEKEPDFQNENNRISEIEKRSEIIHRELERVGKIIQRFNEIKLDAKDLEQNQASQDFLKKNQKAFDGILEYNKILEEEKVSLEGEKSDLLATIQNRAEEFYTKYKKDINSKENELTLAKERILENTGTTYEQHLKVVAAVEGIKHETEAQAQAALAEKGVNLEEVNGQLAAVRRAYGEELPKINTGETGIPADPSKMTLSAEKPYKETIEQQRGWFAQFFNNPVKGLLSGLGRGASRVSSLIEKASQSKKLQTAAEVTSNIKNASIATILLGLIAVNPAKENKAAAQTPQRISTYEGIQNITPDIKVTVPNVEQVVIPKEKVVASAEVAKINPEKMINTAEEMPEFPGGYTFKQGDTMIGSMTKMLTKGGALEKTNLWPKLIGWAHQKMDEDSAKFNKKISKSAANTKKYIDSFLDIASKDIAEGYGLGIKKITLPGNKFGTAVFIQPGMELPNQTVFDQISGMLAAEDGLSQQGKVLEIKIPDGIEFDESDPNKAIV